MDARYRIEGKLATGGFGTIYRATDTVIGRQVALKILHRELAADASVVGRFRREIAALAKLKSTHTLTIYDVGNADDTLYFVMELLRGESLYDVYTRTGPLAWHRLANIARGVCSSLREAHALGIVHRDLKPANIFLETHGVDVDHVKVLDFGIAKLLATSELENCDLTRHGQMIGTFDYMAPEQMIGGELTSKSDVFTLGIVLYEMLTGGRPYGENSGPAQMVMALLTQSPAPPTGAPFEMTRIIMKCLEREPQERPDVDEIDAVLASLLGVDDSAFSDDDEPTLVVAHPPVAPPGIVRHEAARDVMAHGPTAQQATAFVQTLMGSAGPAQQRAQAILANALEPQTGVARGSEVAIARGSVAAIARDIDLALASTQSHEVFADSFLAQGTRQPSITPVDRAPEVAVRFVPTLHSPMPAAKARLAAGTSPIDSEEALAEKRVVARPLVTLTAPDRSLSLVRCVTIAVCLFGVGFLAALSIFSL